MKLKPTAAFGLAPKAAVWFDDKNDTDANQINTYSW